MRFHYLFQILPQILCSSESLEYPMGPVHSHIQDPRSSSSPQQRQSSWTICFAAVQPFNKHIVALSQALRSVYFFTCFKNIVE